MRIPSIAQRQVALVHNRCAANHEATLLAALKAADEILISVAFMKDGALKRLLPTLEKALHNGAKATVIVGGDFYLTEPDSLLSLHNLCDPYPNADAYLVQPGKDTYHPKVYCAVRGETVTILLGSANLTNGGLSGNFELSVLYRANSDCDLFASLKEWFGKIQTHTRATKLDPLSIGAYRVKYDIYAQCARRAEKLARQQIQRQFKFDRTLLVDYVNDYMSDKREQQAWAQKVKNYRQARQVLDSMITSPPTGRAEFLTRYGHLVGAAGADKLWHSGSIFRAKNSVADAYQKFIALVKTLHSALGQSPDKIFALGMSLANEIHGLGPNVLTEILNTYAPAEYAVLNKNPVGSLRKMGIANFPAPGSFRSETYAQYNGVMKQLAGLAKFQDLSQVDHFLNHVYWKHVKHGTKSPPV